MNYPIISDFSIAFPPENYTQKLSGARTHPASHELEICDVLKRAGYWKVNFLKLLLRYNPVFPCF